MPRSHPCLVFSSCLFSSVVIHAYYRQIMQYVAVYLVVTVLSIVFHASGRLGVADKLAAHVAFCFTLADAYVAGASSTLAFLGLVACLWLLEAPFPKYATQLHFALHVATLVGMHTHMGVTVHGRDG